LQRIEVNVQTGEQQIIDLTPDEIAAAQAQYQAWQKQQALQPLTVEAWKAKAILKQTPFSSANLDPTIVTIVGSSNNFLDATSSLIAAQSNTIVEAYWNYANQFISNDLVLLSLGNQLGLSNDQISSLFQQAQQINI